VGDPNGNYVVPGSLGDLPFRIVDGKPRLLDAYIQPGDEHRPGVVLIHGGGWTSGSRRAFISHFQELLAQAGFNWFAVDYGLAPAASLAEQIEDLLAAIDFIRCHSDRFKTDSRRLVLLGEDSGAYLAARVALQSPESARAVVLAGGVFELAEFPPIRDDVALQEALFGASGTSTLKRNSLANLVGDRFPPTLLIHGTRDSEAPLEAARSFCTTVSQAGGACRLVPVEGGIHRSENWTPAQRGYRQELVEWLERTCGPIPPATPGSLQRQRLRKDITYARYSEPAPLDLKMDAFVPDGPGPFPAVIVVHGGGWEAGSKTTYVVPVLTTLAKANLAWFSIDYRLTPEFENRDQVEDVRRAIRYVRHHASDYRVDPSKIALLGESAGGQLVVQVGALPCPGDPRADDPVDRETCRVSSVVSFYGVYDFAPMVKDAGPRSLLTRLFHRSELDEDARRVMRHYSPYYQVRTGMPPLLLIHGTGEFLWDQAVRLRERLDSLGVDYRLIRLEGAPHGMENWEGRPEWERYKPKLVQWLQQKLSSP
jgi:alpha-L-fucosidase 2